MQLKLKCHTCQNIDLCQSQTTYKNIHASKQYSLIQFQLITI